MQLAELRWQRGLTSQDLVYAGKQQLEAARQRETSVRNQVQVLRNRLAALVGQGPDWGRPFMWRKTRSPDTCRSRKR